MTQLKKLRKEEKTNSRKEKKTNSKKEKKN